MPRASSRFKTEMVKSEVSPVLLVRVLNIPKVEDPEDTASLYLTDCDYDAATGSHTDIWWFDENDNPVQYRSCGLTFDSVKLDMTNEIPSTKLSIDNVDRQFSALAQYYKLNGVEVQVWRGFRNLLNYPDGAQLIFRGHLQKVLINEYSIQADVWADFSLKQLVPKRLYWTNLFPYLPASRDPRYTPLRSGKK